MEELVDAYRGALFAARAENVALINACDMWKKSATSNLAALHKRSLDDAKAPPEKHRAVAPPLTSTPSASAPPPSSSSTPWPKGIFPLICHTCKSAHLKSEWLLQKGSYDEKAGKCAAACPLCGVLCLHAVELFSAEQLAGARPDPPPPSTPAPPSSTPSASSGFVPCARPPPVNPQTDAFRCASCGKEAKAKEWPLVPIPPGAGVVEMLCPHCKHQCNVSESDYRRVRELVPSSTSSSSASLPPPPSSTPALPSSTPATTAKLFHGAVCSSCNHAHRYSEWNVINAQPDQNGRILVACPGCNVIRRMCIPPPARSTRPAPNFAAWCDTCDAWFERSRMVFKSIVPSTTYHIGVYLECPKCKIVASYAKGCVLLPQ